MDPKEGGLLSLLSQLIASGKFVVTAEINPPKGVDIQDTLNRVAHIVGCVDAVSLTDQQGSIMSINPVALVPSLLEQRMDVILQITCRDRNLIALQGDLLSASVLGVENILCQTGDPVGTGDHPEASRVFDLDSIGLLRAATLLMEGKDMASNALEGAPHFYPGAMINPAASETADEIIRMEDKMEAGARFFQTQAVFDPVQLAEFIGMVKPLAAPIVASVIILKSGNMARQLNSNLSGVHVPDHLIYEMDSASDKTRKGIEIAGRFIHDIRDLCSGVHIIATGSEKRIPQVLEVAGIFAS